MNSLIDDDDGSPVIGEGAWAPGDCARDFKKP